MTQTAAGTDAAGPDTGRSGARGRDRRRAQLLEVGARLFATRGYDEVPIDEIAAAAGMSRGLLYHYFPSKQAFHLAVVERTLGEVRALLEPDPDLRPDEALHAVLDRFFAYVGDRDAGVLTITRGHTAASAQLQAHLEAFRAGTVEQVLAALEPTGTPPSPALRTVLRGWTGAVEGLAVGWLLHGDPRSAAERADLTRLAVQLLGECLAHADVSMAGWPR